MQHRVICLSSIAVAAALLAGMPAGAAELGDIAVRTYLNQPLTADIELVMLSPEEAADGVAVRMAGPNIYQGANVRMHPALAGARMSVQRKDARLYVHIVTLQPIDTDVVHLYLELGTGSRAVVRAATVWLTPEPPGAPRPPVVRPLPAPVASAPEPAASAPAMTPPVSRPVASKPPMAAQLRPAPLPPLAELPPPVALSASSSATAITAEPSLPGYAPSEAALIAARARANAEREALMRRAAYGTDLSRGPGQRSVPGGAACAAGASQARQCVALDQKNTELNAKIHDLEGKVKALQSAIGVPAPSAAGAEPAASVANAAPAASNATAAASAASAAAVTPTVSASAPSAQAPAASAAASAASTADASAPMNPAGAVIPPSGNGAHSTNGTNGTNGKRRSGLNATTQIVLGVIATLAVLGTIVYLVRKKKLKLPGKDKLMFWKRWKRNTRDEPVEDASAESHESAVDKGGE